MEEVGWSQAGVWRSERDHFINDDIILGVTDTKNTKFIILTFRLCISQWIFHSKDGRDLYFAFCGILVIKGSVHSNYHLLLL